MILPQPLGNHLLLVVRQVPRVVGRRRQPQQDGDGDEQVDSPDAREHDAPALEGPVGRVLRAVRDEPADDLAGAEAAVPEAEARRRLVLLVPGAREHYECGRDDGLEAAEQGAQRNQLRAVLDDGGARRGDAPEEDVDAEDLGDVELLEQHSCHG